MAEITGEMILADRKQRRKMSREAYAELVGSSPAKVARMEKGQFKDGEKEMMSSFLDGVELTTTAEPEPQPTSETQPQPQPEQQEEPEAEATTEASPEEQQPVVMLSEPELEEMDAVEGEDIITPGSGLPNIVPFELEGYHISNSELQTFKRCKRKWYLAYYRELRLARPERTGPRALGTRLHLALAAYYSTRREDPMEVLEYTIAEDERMLISQGATEEQLNDLKKEAELARAMLEGYIDWVEENGHDEHLEIIGDEMVVEVPFLTAEQADWHQPVHLVGKMDLRVRRTVDLARFFLDHKTVGSLTTPRKTLHMNEQMLFYHLLEYLEFLKEGVSEEQREYSHGGLYNMLRKVKRTVRANPPFFDRAEVRHNMHELNSHWQSVYGEVMDIIELHKKLDAGADHRMAAYPNKSDNCSWDCDFLAVCPMFDDGSAAEEMLHDLYETADPHDHYRPYGYTGSEEGA